MGKLYPQPRYLHNAKTHVTFQLSTAVATSKEVMIMESKYTATVYANDHAVKQQVGNDLTTLMATLMVQLEGCLSGSYGVIRDNALNMVIQRYKKAIIED